MASLFAAELLAGKVTGWAPSSNAPPFLYTMGSPRVGNAIFAQAYTRALRAADADAWRLVNDADPVPHLAPQHFPGEPYTHVPYEVWLRPAGSSNRTICDGSGEDPHCSDSLSALELRPTHHTSYFNLNANLCLH